MICFLLNTLNVINSFSFLYFLLSWLPHQLINYFTQDWGQPYWPGAACVILAALFECSTLAFRGNLPGLPSYIKNMPEIFFRQIFRTIWGQIYGLPHLKFFSETDALYHPVQLLADWRVLHPQVKKGLYPFFLPIWDRDIYWMFVSSVSLTVLSPSKNFNHWNLSQMLKYFRNYLRSSSVSLRYRNVSDVSTFPSSLLYICIYVDFYLVFAVFISFPLKQHVQKEAVCVYLSKSALIHPNVALKHTKSSRFAWSNAKMWKLLNPQQLPQIIEE